MNKMLAIAIVVVSLSACSRNVPHDVKPEFVEFGEKLCMPNGGLDFMRLKSGTSTASPSNRYFPWSFEYHCKNEAVFSKYYSEIQKEGDHVGVRSAASQ